MKKIILIGSSGHAKVIIDIIEQEKNYQLIGLIDPARAIGEKVSGYSVIGREEEIPSLIAQYKIEGAVIAIGDNWVRGLVARKIKHLAPQLSFVSPVHPFTSIGKDVTIGAGTVVMAGVCINPGTTVGDFCILNTKASLDHDCILENYASLAPGVTTGGNVRIGEYTAISLGANILHGINIGKHSVVGAGALVNKNIEDEVVVYGVPARVARKRNKGEKYL